MEGFEEKEGFLEEHFQNGIKGEVGVQGAIGPIGIPGARGSRVWLPNFNQIIVKTQGDRGDPGKVIEVEGPFAPSGAKGVMGAKGGRGLKVIISFGIRILKMCNLGKCWYRRHERCKGSERGYFDEVLRSTKVIDFQNLEGQVLMEEGERREVVSFVSMKFYAFDFSNWSPRYPRLRRLLWPLQPATTSSWILIDFEPLFIYTWTIKPFSACSIVNYKPLELLLLLSLSRRQ